MVITQPVFGEIVWCPRCKGKGTIPNIHPDKPRVPCGRCKGMGTVKNEGPIAPIKKP